MQKMCPIFKEDPAILTKGNHSIDRKIEYLQPSVSKLAKLVYGQNCNKISMVLVRLRSKAQASTLNPKTTVA